MLPPARRRSEHNCLYFEAPYAVAVRRRPLRAPGLHEVVVRTAVSAISAGTEMLFYRGDVPEEMALDATLPALAGECNYPLRYGYACVGVVEALGAGVEPTWQGRRVFAFEPHADSFVARCADLLAVPDAISDEVAALLSNAETAVNLVLDGAPLLGERVAIFGAGIVGLLVAARLSAFPLAALTVVEPSARRRERAALWGAAVRAAAGGDDPLRNQDLVYELSGNPAALDAAIASAGFDARVVVGSWYGRKTAPLQLGGHFHRSRIRLVSSQVSTIAPALAGRWSKQRRIDEAWRLLQSIDASALITHRIPFDQADYAYRLIDQQPGDVLQLLFTYAPEPRENVG